MPDDPAILLSAPQAVYKGWPLGKSAIALELMAVAGRVAGVEFVQNVLLAKDGGPVPQVDFSGLELPRVLGISVTDGDPLGLADLQGTAPPTGGGAAGAGAAQVPVIPQECQ